MQTYSEFQPTSFDSRGAFLSENQNWLVVPVTINRDSQPIELSNWHAALNLLGGESDNVEIHRFGHWSCGWFEIILVRPDTPEANIAQNIKERLESYPVLDDDDLSAREFDDQCESWDNWARRDFVRELVREFDLSDHAESVLDSIDSGIAFELFRDFGGEVEQHNDGPHFGRFELPTRQAMALIIKRFRHGYSA